MLKDLILKNRSIRRFYQDAPVGMDMLRDLVELARLSPSGGNRQPLKFMLSCDPGRNAIIFEHLAWAAYLKDWPGPAEGERPSAYIVILGDTSIARSFDCDQGIAAQSIMLGAAELGLAGCILGSVQRHGLQKTLGIPEQYQILLVLALGRPKEKIVLEAVGPSGDIKYWRDRECVHHVPKRALKDIIVDFAGGA